MDHISTTQTVTDCTFNLTVLTFTIKLKSVLEKNIKLSIHLFQKRGV